MNRLFGRGKPKEPPPNINDCIAGVSIYLCTNISYKVLSNAQFAGRPCYEVCYNVFYIRSVSKCIEYNVVHFGTSQFLHQSVQCRNERSFDHGVMRLKVVGIYV